MKKTRNFAHVLAVTWCVDTAADAANTGTGGSGDEILSAAVSATLQDTQSAQLTENHVDNRMSEAVVDDASEKCNSRVLSYM